MNFEDVIGQEEIKAVLKRQFSEHRVAHAQIFCGPEGCGKFATAYAFASLLLCEHPTADGEPCGTCKACRMTQAMGHPDLHFVFPAYKKKDWPATRKATSDDFMEPWREMVKASAYFDLSDWRKNNGVEGQKFQIGIGEAENIIRKLSLVASQGGYKVVIMWLPEMMDESCANKILKTLEEPPSDTVFLLVSNAPERLLSTISSRVQRIDFKRLSEESLADVMQRVHHLDEDEARITAHNACGSYVNALRQLKLNEDEAQYFDMFVLLMRKCYTRDIKELYAWADNLAKWTRQKQLDFLAYCQRLVRENFMFNFGQSELTYMKRNERDFGAKFARFINERNVYEMMQEFADAERDIRQNGNGSIVYTDLSLRMIVLVRR